MVPGWCASPCLRDRSASFATAASAFLCQYLMHSSMLVLVRVQVAYAWAISLGGDEGAVLLKKLGLLEQVSQGAGCQAVEGNGRGTGDTTRTAPLTDLSTK